MQCTWHKTQLKMKENAVSYYFLHNIMIILMTLRTYVRTFSGVTLHERTLAPATIEGVFLH